MLRKDEDQRVERRGTGEGVKTEEEQKPAAVVKTERRKGRVTK